MPGVAQGLALGNPSRLREKGAWRPAGQVPVSEVNLLWSKRILTVSSSTPSLRACLLVAETGVSSHNNKLKAFPLGVSVVRQCVPKWAAGGFRSQQGRKLEQTCSQHDQPSEECQGDGGGQDACPLSSVLLTWRASRSFPGR